MRRKEAIACILPPGAVEKKVKQGCSYRPNQNPWNGHQAPEFEYARFKCSAVCCQATPALSSEDECTTNHISSSASLLRRARDSMLPEQCRLAHVGGREYTEECCQSDVVEIPGQGGVPDRSLTRSCTCAPAREKLSREPRAGCFFCVSFRSGQVGVRKGAPGSFSSALTN